MKRDEREVLTREVVKARLMHDFKRELVNAIFPLLLGLPLCVLSVSGLIAADITGILLLFLWLVVGGTCLFMLAMVTVNVGAMLRPLLLARTDRFSLVEDTLKRASEDELDKRAFFTMTLDNVFLARGMVRTQHALYFEKHGRCVVTRKVFLHADPGERYYLVLDGKGKVLYAYHTDIYRLAPDVRLANDEMSVR